MRITYPDSVNLSGSAHTLRIPPRGMRRQGQGKHTCTRPRPIGGRRGACGARPRCRRAAARPDQAHAHQAPPDGRPSRGLRGLAAVPEGCGRARTRTHARLEAIAWPAGPGRGAGGRRQGLAGLRDDAPGHTPATRRRRCGGRRRDRRARAGFEIDHSEPQARVWRSRGRPGPTAPGTPAAQQAPLEIWRDHSHNRQSPGRLLHNSPHGSSPRRPWRICHDV